jgi:hypothetical protein
MKADGKLRNIILLMLNSFESKNVRSSLQEVFSYIVTSKEINLVDLVFKQQHLLGNSMFLIVTSVFLIVLHFINIL